MKIEYKKLVSEEDFSQCIALQRSLFNLSDVDIVSPLILQLIARENPPMGIMLGAFDVSEDKQELVGFIFSMATFQGKSIYVAMLGVKPQYRNQGHGLNLFLKLREVALDSNIDYMYGVFEPLEKNLAHLFIQQLGFSGIHYQESVYYLNKNNEENQLPTDKILFKWDLNAFSPTKGSKITSNELFGQYPVATIDEKPESPFVFVEIPSDFNLLRKEDITKAMYWRQSTRDILVHYINHRKYIIYDCLSFEENQIKKSFYLLKTQ